VEVMGQLSNQDRRLRIRQLHAVMQEQCLSNPLEMSTGDCVPRRKQHRLSAAQVAELVLAYQSGVSLHSLATQFQVHRSTVLDHLNRAGTQRRYPALAPAQVELAARFYQGGQSLREVGVHLGVHASTVRNALRRAGVQMRDCQGRAR